MQVCYQKDNDETPQQAICQHLFFKLLQQLYEFAFISKSNQSVRALPPLSFPLFNDWLLWSGLMDTNASYPEDRTAPITANTGIH